MQKEMNNEPAFPVENRNIFCLKGHEDCAKAIEASLSPGLSKREWYAGMALQGMISKDTYTFHQAAIDAFKFADALDVTASGFPQKFYCPDCVYDFVESDR